MNCVFPCVCGAFSCVGGAFSWEKGVLDVKLHYFMRRSFELILINPLTEVELAEKVIMYIVIYVSG